MSNQSWGTRANLVAAGLWLGAGVLFVACSGGGANRCPGQLSASPGDVLNKTAYSDDALLADVSSFTYDDRGENDHPMYAAGGSTPIAKASIQRLAGSGHRRASCFDDHPTVVAVIHSDADFTPLKLAGSQVPNWFVVWHDTNETDPKKAWHGAMLSLKQREYITFEYKEHWRSGGPADADDPTYAPPGELVSKLQDCWKATNPTRRACFGELQKAPGIIGATGFGLVMFPLQAEDGSIPWVACAQAGCCCGGEGCHY